jgi:hypothetical protein
MAATVKTSFAPAIKSRVTSKILNEKYETSVNVALVGSCLGQNVLAVNK